MEFARSHAPEDFVGNPQVSSAQSRLHPDTGWKRTVKDSGKHCHLGSSIPKILHVLPRGIADSSGSDLVRKAVKDAKRFVFLVIHQFHGGD
jgi:hypothetical protein